MAKPDKDQIRIKVRERYAAVASAKSAGCGCSTPSCCSTNATSAKAQSSKLGYSAKELDAVPADANMGLGCGNPQAIARLKKGDAVEFELLGDADKDGDHRIEKIVPWSGK